MSKWARWSLKVFLFAVSTLLTLGAAEFGLRWVGFPPVSDSTFANVPPYDDRFADQGDIFERYVSEKKGKHVLLTLGDSFTDGGNVNSYHSYPYFLYRALAVRGEDVSVINLARKGDSTFDVPARLKRHLDGLPASSKPDAAVVLVGASDLFRLPFADNAPPGIEEVPRDVLPVGLKRLQLYEVYRHAKMFIARISESLEHFDNDSPMLEQRKKTLEALLGVYAAYKAGPELAQRAPLPPVLVGRLREALLEGEYHDEAELETLASFLRLLVEYASIIYVSQRQDGRFYALLRDIAETFPVEFWSPPSEALATYFVEAYRYEDRKDAADVLKLMERSAEAYPVLLKNVSFLNFKEFLSHPKEVLRRLTQRRTEAWARIVAICRENKIALIVLNYPFAFPDANQALQEVARTYGLPLVDNRARFAALLSEGYPYQYIEDYGTLTPDGYRELAENAALDITFR